MTKEKLLEAINEMPQQIELEALFEKLVFIDKVERGLEQIEAGKTTGHTEVLNEVVKWKKIRWTDLALEDLKAIHEYISKDSTIYASKFIEKLVGRVSQLASNEWSGRIVPEFESETIRELIEGNYRIIYKLATSQVFIVRVHHSARLLREI